MLTVTPLSNSLIIDAVVAENLKYKIDDDGDVSIVFGRDKGKDIHYYVTNPDRTDGFLVFWSVVYRIFSSDKVPELLVFCNSWNRERRMPRAFVSSPDKDNDFTARLDHHVLCESGVHREFIRENLSLFIAATSRFWDELDEAI